MKNKGFTLIEMSIVLVIIGLIVGGIIVGQSLIHQAEIRKLVTQVQQFDTAINTFHEKYGCLPGDCSTAYQLGFTDRLGAPITANSINNGNGDGKIFNVGGHAFEITYAFMWLYQAGLTPVIGASFSDSQYNFPYNTGMDNASIPIALGGGRLLSAMSSNNNYPFTWNVLYIDPSKSVWYLNGTNTFFSHPGHYYWMSPDMMLNETNGAETISPADAYAFDAKIDDGMPRSGKVLASGDDNEDNANGGNYFPVFDIDPGDAITESGPAGASPSPSSCIASAVANTPPYSYNVSNTLGDYGWDNGTGVGAMCTLTVEANF